MAAFPGNKSFNLTWACLGLVDREYMLPLPKSETNRSPALLKASSKGLTNPEVKGLPRIVVVAVFALASETVGNMPLFLL
jgi:hypothetical protein